MGTAEITVDCYVRASTAKGAVGETIETLRAYEGRGVIEDLGVELWPDEVMLTAETEETALVGRYRRFRAWAEQADVSLRPAFQTRERATLVSERPARALVLPTVCLAVRVDGQLASVVPHRADGATYTVGDALGDLTAPDRPVPSLPVASPTDPSFPSA